MDARPGLTRSGWALAVVVLVALTAGCSGAAAAHRPAPPPPTGAAGVPDLPPSAVQSAVAASSSIQQLSPQAQLALNGAVDDNEFGAMARRGCLAVFTTTSLSPGNCVFGDPSGRHTLVVLGDGQAAMWLPALDALGFRVGWRVIDFNKVSCPPADVPVYLNQQSRPYTECGAWLKWALPEINSLEPDIFMTVGATGYRILGGATLEQGLARTLAAVTSPGTRKVVLGDIAYLAQNGPDCLAAHTADAQACSTPRYAAVNEPGRQAEMAAASASHAAFIDPVAWLCTTTCSATVGKMIVYQDEQSLTRTYVDYLSGTLQAALQPQIDAVAGPGSGSRGTAPAP